MNVVLGLGVLLGVREYSTMSGNGGPAVGVVLPGTG
jgi:hypothetical protein